MPSPPHCPVACILDILGDKWTLLVGRDLLSGKHTFKEILASLEKIPGNILADRLKRLEREGTLRHELYQQRPNAMFTARPSGCGGPRFRAKAAGSPAEAAADRSRR